MFGFFSSMVLLALLTQKVLGYDAWTSGTVLAPGGVGNLALAGHRRPPHHRHGPAAAPGRRLPAQRLGGLQHVGGDARRGLLGARVAAVRAGPRRRASSSCRSTRWRWPPSRASAWATPPRCSTSCATSGGGIGVALVSTLLARRSQAAPLDAGRPRQPVRPRDDRAPAAPGPRTSPPRAPTPTRRSAAPWPPSTTRSRARPSSWPSPTTSGCCSSSSARRWLLLPLLQRVRVHATSTAGHARRADDAPAPIHAE